MNVKIVLGAIVGVLVVIQFIPVSRTNPPVEQELDFPADVKPIVRRACYDCHSNETVWPGYSKVAPISWLVASDVNEGREELNFSTWQKYSPAQKAKLFKKSREEIEEGEMPPAIYLPLHSEAKLTEAEKSALMDAFAKMNP